MEFKKSDVIVAFMLFSNLAILFYTHYQAVSVQTLSTTATYYASNPSQQALASAITLISLFVYGFLFASMTGYYIALRNRQEGFLLREYVWIFILVFVVLDLLMLNLMVLY